MVSRRVLVIAIVVAIVAAGAYAQKPKLVLYSAALSGANEVPPVRTNAKGMAMFTVVPGGTAVNYKITVTGITDPTMAHIHLGQPGKNGPPAVELMIPKVGTPAQGIITAKSLMGPLKGKTLADLQKSVMGGNAYVNVHTKAHPNGEIRGPIEVKK